MPEAVVEDLILDLLEWLAVSDRDYVEVMDAWRTSCPKLPVWEDATEQGLVAVTPRNGRNIVRITSAGTNFLAQRRVMRARRS